MKPATNHSRWILPSAFTLAVFSTAVALMLSGLPSASANTLLSAPTLSATSGNGWVNLTWTNSPGSDHYQVRWSATGGTSSGEWLTVYDDAVRQRTLRVSGLTNGTTYMFQVRAGKTFQSRLTSIVTHEYGDPSNTVTATPTDD